MSGNFHLSPMQRVSRQNPCPVCDHPDWCLVAPDGAAAICPRVEQGSVKQCGAAGWLHILNSESFEQRAQAVPLPSTCPSTAPRDWSLYLDKMLRHAPMNVGALALTLGVARESLERLRTGYDPARQWWLFPERDALGTVIGILRRNRYGEKRRIKRSRCGLCYPDRWDQAPGPVLLVEGPSDTAAVLTMGLCGVGRPSNTGGVDHLIELLEFIPVERDVVVIGERDQKPDGRWPGKTGAISTATQLAEALERPICWSLPPDKAKDTRAWMQRIPRELPRDQLADLFLLGLDPISVAPTPHVVYTPPTGPDVNLADWRAQMLQVRIASLDAPGCYLDASATGTGKTFVDLQTLLHAARLEAA